MALQIVAFCLKFSRLHVYDICCGNRITSKEMVKGVFDFINIPEI